MKEKVLQELEINRENLLIRLNELDEAIGEISNAKSDELLVAYQELIRNKSFISEAITKIDDKISMVNEMSAREERKVTVEINGRRKVLSIVNPNLAKLRPGMISAISPLARALIGRKVGEEFQFLTPVGTKTCRILAIT